LHENIALGQQLQSLECRTVRTQKTLAALDKALLVPHNPTDLDDVRLHVVIQDLQRLLHGDTTSQELDEITGLNDDVGISGLAGGLHGHGTFDEVKLASNAKFLRVIIGKRTH
jgi:hypothetical protein